MYKRQVKRRRRARFFRKVVAQSYPTRIIIQFSRCMKKSFTYSHWERSNAPPKQEKYLRIWKVLSPVPTGKSKIIGWFWKVFYPMKITPSLIWTKGAEMHTHFRAFSRKFFEKKFYPSLIWNYKAKWHPISQKKWENIFYPVAGWLIFTCPKYPFTYLELGG